MKENLTFRAWYYFRMGWSTYFAFVFAAINTLTVTYYLAIEKAPVLKDVFPSFIYYVVILTLTGIPILVIIGYSHFKKSSAYKAEADISFESHPHMKRILQNTENMLPLYLKMSEMMIKISKNEKLSDKEIEEVSILQNELSRHIEQRLSGKYESNVYGTGNKQ